MATANTRTECAYGRRGELTAPITREIVEGARRALGGKLVSVVLYGYPRTFLSVGNCK